MMRGVEQTQEVGALTGGEQTWPIVERPIEMLIGNWGGIGGIGGDAGVAARRSGRGGAADAVGEGGEEQEAAGGEGVAPGAGGAHVGEDAVDFVNDGPGRLAVAFRAGDYGGGRKGIDRVSFRVKLT